MYRQCELQRGTTGQIAWIPEIFAKVGSYVKITEDDKTEDGWLVKRAGATRLSGDYLRDREREHLYHRRATDI